MWARLARLAQGHFDVMEEIAGDREATQQAVIVSAVSFAVLVTIFDTAIQAPVLGIVLGVVGLMAWTGVLWATGRIVGGKARPVQVLRVLGYVSPPLAVAPIPIFGVMAGIGAISLQVVAMRRTHRINTLRAVVATVPPWIGLILFGVAVSELA